MFQEASSGRRRSRSRSPGRSRSRSRSRERDRGRRSRSRSWSRERRRSRSRSPERWRRRHSPPRDEPRRAGAMAGSGYRREAGAMDGSAPVDERAVDELIVLRMRARSMREYARADQLRDQLRGMGVEVYDDERMWRVENRGGAGSFAASYGGGGGGGGGEPQRRRSGWTRGTPLDPRAAASDPGLDVALVDKLLVRPPSPSEYPGLSLA